MKLFISESGSQNLIDVFTLGEGRTLVVSVLAAVEVRSAIRRRQFARDIDEPNATLAVGTLSQETGRILEHPISAAVIAEATGLVDRHGLRALDAIQLATAIVARSSMPNSQSFMFVASDHRLLEAALRESFRTWDPSHSPPP